MRPLAKVHLGDGAAAELGEYIDEQPELDPVAVFEADRGQSGTPDGGLPGEWLGDVGEFGVEALQQGSGDKFGYPATPPGAPGDRRR